MSACRCCSHPLEHLIRDVVKAAPLLTSRSIVGRLSDGLAVWQRKTAKQQAIRSISELRRTQKTRDGVELFPCIVCGTLSDGRRCTDHIDTAQEAF